MMQGHLGLYQQLLMLTNQPLISYVWVQQYHQVLVNQFVRGIQFMITQLTLLVVLTILIQLHLHQVLSSRHDSPVETQVHSFLEVDRLT